MVVEASIAGLFRTVLIILGAFVLLRFLGQLMMAKRNMEEERKINERQRAFEKERSQKLRNFGKVNILTKSKRKTGISQQAEDADYEEID